MPLLTNGERIAELRERRAWANGDLAERIGTTANYVTQIERGHRNASKRLLRKIAEVFDVEIAEISDYQPRETGREGAA